MKLKNFALLICFVFLIASCSDEKPVGQNNSAIEEFRDASQVLAIINDKEINQAQFELYKRAILLSQPNLTDQEILDKMINFELLSQKAKSENLDKTMVIQARLHLQENELLSDLYIKQFISNQTNESQLKQEYEQIKATTDNEEILLRHIMTESESEMISFIDQIKVSSFEQVASNHNKNNLGGLVGWITIKETIPAIREVLTKLPDNKVSQPIRSPFGWHLVKIDSRRQTEFLDFDQVKADLQKQVLNKKMNDLLSSLKSDADIKILANFATQ